MKKIWRVFALLLLIGCLFSSCGGEKDTITTTSGDAGQSVTDTSVTQPIKDENMLYFICDGKSDYKVVRPERASGTLLSRVSKLYRSMIDTTGVKMQLSDDWVRNEADIDVSAPEILIGETNRPQSRAVMAEIEDCTFDIRVEDNKLIICGANATMLSYALDYFEENILTDSRYFSADGFCLEKDFHYVSEKYPATIPNLVRSGVKYRADSKLYTTFVPQGNYKIVQGGGSDGTYFYMAMIDSKAAPGEGVIRKIDIKTKKVVKTSEVLQLGHCNDITYNEKTGQLVVSFCESPYYDRAYFVDPDTLTITGYQTLSEGFYAIAYSSERDQYVTARSGGQYMTIYDGNFKPIKTLTVKPTGYTTQGIECDENYIYCVQYVKNVLLVYDWDGNLLTETILRFGQEPENVMIVDGQMYVGCNNSSWSGGEIVTVDLVPIG